MKNRTTLLTVLRAMVVLLAVASVFRLIAFAEEEPFARITAVRVEGTNVVVEVEASAGFTKVTLESSARLGRRAWLPRGVQVVQGGAAVANATFRVSLTPELEVLRVRADRVQESLPADFYTGTNEFTVPGGATSGGGAEYNDGGATAGPGAGDSRDDGAPRNVVESDIWKLEGDKLFFFNQYRGLQVIDVTNPDEPVVTGSYDLPGAGEQMYVINGTNVVLLARDNCAWYGTESQSRIVLLQLRDGTPHLVKELSVPGQIDESRLVGSALYVVANSYQRKIVSGPSGGVTSETWEYGTEVVSFDLADFANATQKSRDWVSGYSNVIMATDRYLFVAQYAYDSATSQYTSTIHSFDISSPAGDFVKKATFDAGGLVRDKFKMHMDGDVFVVVVDKRTRNSTGAFVNSPHVRTFSFADPTAPQLLAELKIIENEQLFATRFDGHRLYVVTFMQIDPLWIIDLSDPAAPKKLGELEIPGWSTFLQPLENGRLLTIGIDNTEGWRTSVQLFNVSDAANPTLLSKVLIGDQWSGSEANWDEKAFGVLPEENLVLVPFYSSGSLGYLQGVQLIDLLEDSLVRRGIVEHSMGARRATIHRERLLSLSSRELLTVDVTNRDEPKVVNAEQLSWSADKVHLVGDYLIEVDSGDSAGPILRAVDAADTFTIRSSVVLTNLPYLGSAEQNGKLYVLQGRGIEYIYPEIYNPTNYYPIKTNPAVLVLTSFDLSKLPNLSVHQQVVTEGQGEYYYGRFQGLQVKDDLLVWASTASWGYPLWLDIGGPVAEGAPGGGIVRAASDAISDGRFAPWPWWGGGAGQLIAVDLSGAAPEFASQVKLTGTNGWWNFSDSFAVNGMVYTGHQASEYDSDIDPPPYTYLNWNGKDWITVTNDPPPGAWVQRYYLDVVDFADPHDPLLRPPVNVPGTVIGVAANGELIHTRGYDGDPFTYSGEESISALSYDGVAAHLVATLKLDTRWPKPAISDEGYVYLGSPATTNEAPTLQVWTVSAAKKFEQVETVTLSSAAQQLKQIDDLLVVQSSTIDLFNATDPADLVRIGSAPNDVCYGLMLDGADGEVTRGLWLPVGWYGVIHVPVGTGQ